MHLLELIQRIIPLGTMMLIGVEGFTLYKLNSTECNDLPNLLTKELNTIQRQDI